ncbi:MAG: hypothetical protein ABL921_10295 [Pirellula sp.]
MVHRTSHAAVLLPLVLFLGVAKGEDRELVFANDFDYATVSLFGPPEPAPDMTGFQYFAINGQAASAAKGIVHVPNDSFVSVGITARDRYLEFIASLPTMGINRLELRGARLSTSLMNLLEKLQSVRQLVLVDCELGELDASRLQGAPQLQEVSVQLQHGRELRRLLLPWLAKCTSLQSMSSDIPMNADELKWIRQLRSPMSIRNKGRRTLASISQTIQWIGPTQLMKAVRLLTVFTYLHFQVSICLTHKEN